MNKTLRIFIFSITLALLGASQASAAISVLKGTGSGLTGNGNLSPSTPSGSLSGDVLVAQVATKAAATIKAPTGWTEVKNANSAQNGIEQRIYYLNLSAAPASSYTWIISGNASNSSAAVIYALHGAQPADCSGTSGTVNCTGSYQSSNGGATAIAPPIQTQPPTYPAGSLRMAFFAENDGSATIAPTLENGATPGEYFRAGANSNGIGIHGTYYLLTGDSNGDQQSATLSGGTGSNIGNFASTFIIAQAPVCLTDTFDRTTGVGSDWATARVNGSFTPSIVNGRLRLTDTGTQESTAASFQRLLPGSSNYIQLTFTYYGYGGTGADGIAMILSDASVTPQPGGFGGSLGYAPKGSTPGFAGGWLGLGLDEYGNFSNKSDSGPCAPSIGTGSCATSAVKQSVSIRGSTPNYYWLGGTGTLGTTVSTTSTKGHLYRITVDSRLSNQANVTVERDTTGLGSSYTTLISSFNAATASGQAAIPANFILSLTGSTGDSTNTHEIDSLQICAQRMNPIVAIDHYEFTVKNTALTCAPATVSVRACMDAACSTTYSGNATVTLLPAGAWVGGDTKTFPGSGADFTLSETTAGTYTLGVVSSSSSPAMKAFTTNPALCSIAGSAFSSNCNLTFSDSGLWYDVPALTSGKTSAAITITAAKTDTSVTPNKGDLTNRCIPAFVGTRSIKFWSSYVSPDSATITGTPTLTMNSTVLSTDSTKPSTVPLIFDATGQATFTLNYPDAGELSLNARYDGSTSTNDNGLKLLGSSTFAVVPAGLCVDSPDIKADNSPAWLCNQTSVLAQTPANCSVYKKAGENFNLRVTAKADSSTAANICNAPTTPNYKQNGIVLSTSVIAPSGGSNGSLLAPLVNITAGGTNTISQTQSEAGVFTFTATPPAGGYVLGTTVPPGTSLYFGRFIPAGFTITGPVITPRGPLACNPASAFTYLSEPLNLGFTLNAVNASGTTTTNYRGNFARLPLNVIVPPATSNGLYFGAQNNSSTLLNSRLSTTCSGSGGACGVWGNGTTSITTPQTISRAGGKVLDGPFDKTQFGLKLKEPDGVNLLSLNYNWSLATPVVNDGTAIGATTVLRFGRVRMSNAYGSTRLALPVQTSVQFYNGSTFVTNTDDSCTPLTVPAVSGATTAAPPTSGIPSDLTCSTTGGVRPYNNLKGVNASIGGVAAGNSVNVQGGNIKLVLSPPTPPNPPPPLPTGAVDLVLGVPDYLKYDWDGVDQSAACATPGDGNWLDDNPRARIRFGSKTNNSIIYMREVY